MFFLQQVDDAMVIAERRSGMELERGEWVSETT